MLVFICKHSEAKIILEAIIIFSIQQFCHLGALDSLVSVSCLPLLLVKEAILYLTFLQYQTGQVSCDEFSSQQENALVYFGVFFSLALEWFNREKAQLCISPSDECQEVPLTHVIRVLFTSGERCALCFSFTENTIHSWSSKHPLDQGMQIGNEIGNSIIRLHERSWWLLLTLAGILK